MDYKRIGGSLKEFKTEIPLIFLAVSRDAENWMREEWSCVCVYVNVSAHFQVNLVFPSAHSRSTFLTQCPRANGCKWKPRTWNEKKKQHSRQLRVTLHTCRLFSKNLQFKKRDTYLYINCRFNDDIVILKKK